MQATAKNTFPSGLMPFTKSVTNGVRIGLMKNAIDAIIAPPFSIALKYET